MKKLTHDTFAKEGIFDNQGEQVGLIADDDTLDLLAQEDIFSHRFTIIPDIIRAGNLSILNPVTRELLARYLEGTIETTGQFKRKEDKIKKQNIFIIGKIYEELLPNYQHEKRGLLFSAICERCINLEDREGKLLTKRNLREYYDQYELKRKKQIDALKRHSLADS